MKSPIALHTPFSGRQLGLLRAGDEVALSGDIFTARDQAHQRMAACLRKGRALPFAPAGQAIYYCGPTPAPAGAVIGSCGPTTSRRMDGVAPALLAAGLKAMIGKGDRSPAVYAAIRKYRAVYFVAYAGCGALISRHVRSSRVVAYPDLGPEAVRCLTVRGLPLLVAIDCRGTSIFTGKAYGKTAV